MMTGKKRALLALLLVLTMVFSVMFGTVSALATFSQYTLNVQYRYGSTTIANGPTTTFNENQLNWQQGEWVWDLWPILGHHNYYANVTVTENYAGATAAPGKDKTDYGIAPGATTTVQFKKSFLGDTETAIFQLSQVLDYAVSVKYMCDGVQIGGIVPGPSGTIVDGAAKSVTVNGTLPYGYTWASGEDGTESVTITGTNLTPTVTFQLAFIPYDYTVNVEYWYNGAKIADGTSATGSATSDPKTVSVTPSYTDPVYRLVSTASKNGTVTRANPTDTVVFELELIPSDTYSISIIYMCDGVQVGGIEAGPSGTILEGQSLNVPVSGTLPSGYKWAAANPGGNTTQTVTYTDRTPTTTLYLDELWREGYTVTVQYFSTVGGGQVGSDILYANGPFTENDPSFDVPVNSADHMPSGYALAAGESAIKTVTIDEGDALHHTVRFDVTPVAQEYTYIITVEYRYDGQLIRTGNQLTAIVSGLSSLDITVTPDANIIPEPYFLLGTDPKLVTVSPGNNVLTVAFELNSDEVPLAIPDEDVPLAEPTTGTAPNMLLIISGIALTIAAVGLCTFNFFKQKKSPK
ncbi:MAG: hypothetical protein AAGU74_10350 [Bacillota bacterium]